MGRWLGCQLIPSGVAGLRWYEDGDPQPWQVIGPDDPVPDGLPDDIVAAINRNRSPEGIAAAAAVVASFD